MMGCRSVSLSSALTGIGLLGGAFVSSIKLLLLLFISSVAEGTYHPMRISVSMAVIDESLNARFSFDTLQVECDQVWLGLGRDDMSCEYSSEDLLKLVERAMTDSSS